MVQRVCETAPINVRNMMSHQLDQLNTMTVPGVADGAALSLHGDQHTCYNTITQTILTSRYHWQRFFVTRPGGTGKSFLFCMIQHWCNNSHNPCLLLAPTGITARNLMETPFIQPSLYTQEEAHTAEDSSSSVRKIKRSLRQRLF